MHHVRVALDRESLGDLDAAGLGNASDVVAGQIDQHQMLGSLFRIGIQFSFERQIELGRRTARAGAGQGSDGDLVACRRVLAAHQDFRRGTDDLEVAHVVEIHVGRRVERAQRAVQAQRALRVGLAQPLTHLHLHHVAGGDVLLGAQDRGDVVVLGEITQHLAQRAGLNRRGLHALVEPSDQRLEALTRSGQGVGFLRVRVNDQR